MKAYKHFFKCPSYPLKNDLYCERVDTNFKDLILEVKRKQYAIELQRFTFWKIHTKNSCNNFWTHKSRKQYRQNHYSWDLNYVRSKGINLILTVWHKMFNKEWSSINIVLSNKKLYKVQKILKVVFEFLY